MSSEARPLLIVVSAPSGAGKSTLCRRLVAEEPDIVYSVSCTTRPPRGREQHGRDYFFLDPDDFERRARQDLFLEHASVHGYRYGTLRETVRDVLSNGQSVLMDIDVQGAAQIRRAARRSPEGDLLRDGFVDIFIAPPSLETLRERLEKRGEDEPDTVARRLRNAEKEMACQSDFSHKVVNDDLETAYARFKAILQAERDGKRE